MSDRGAAAWRAVLLLASAGVIVKLFAAGEMVKYIAPPLDPLTALTAIVFAVMGAMEAGRALFGRHASSGDDDVPGHDHEAGDLLERLVTFGLVLLPLGLALFVSPRALGSSALGGERVTGMLLTFAPSATTATPPAPSAEPLDDVGPLLAYLRKVGDAGIGRPARVTGMVVRSGALGPGEFVLLRYSIAHCVADARPVALLVAARAIPDVAPDQWVEIEGDVASRERDGDRVVSIVARRITVVDEPRSPYLSGSY